MTELGRDDAYRAELSAIARILDDLDDLDDLDKRDVDGDAPIEEWQDMARQRRQLIARRQDLLESRDSAKPFR